jgi:hypothetical protein
VNHVPPERPSSFGADEVIYRGISPWKPCLQLLAAGLVAGAIAAGFALSDEFRARLRIDAEAGAGPVAAAISGGVATILIIYAAWLWYSRLQWVIVGPNGLRWRAGRVKFRKWDRYIRVHRGSIHVSVYGEDLRTGRYADVEFKNAAPLRIGTDTIHGYEDLIAVIETTAAAAGRAFLGGSAAGQSNPDVVRYGPLHFDTDGLGWDKTYYRWDEIENYEVAVGCLRIQPVNGPEFFRRLLEFGDWQPVLAQLDRNIGSRRVGGPASSPGVPKAAAPGAGLS